MEKSLRETCHRTRKSFKQVLNETLRKALVAPSRDMPELLPPKSMGVPVGHDPARMQELADEMELEAYRGIEARNITDLKE